jgi:hypothetical protein
MYITIQIQLDEERDFTMEEIEICQGEMLTCCSSLEKIGYVRAQISVDGKVLV